MNEYNNLSVLPFYSRIEDQNARRWWVYGRVYPLFCGGALLPFQYSTDNYLLVHNTFGMNVNLYSKDGEFMGRLEELENLITTEKIDGKVYFTSKKRIAPGEFCKVKITEALDYDVIGEVIKD